MLSVALETPVYENTSVDLVRVQRELLIRQQAAASLPDVADPRAARPLLRYGHGELALDRYRDSGFGTLNVLSMDSSAPAAVDLRASQAVRLFAGAFTVTEGGPPDTRFGVNAPYVLLAQTDRPNADFLVLPTVHGGLSKQDPTGAFAVHGNTVDVRDRVSFGANGYFLLQGRVLRTVDGQGYGSVSLAADGDLRFLRGAVADGMTILATPGSVALAGARIYPRRKHGPWWNRATTASVSRLCCPEWARTSRRPIRPSASCPSPRRASITARRCGRRWAICRSTPNN